MEWITLAVLLALGLLLIIVEIIFIPGTTVVGIVGFLCLVGGIYSSYATYGEFIGNMVLTGSGLFVIASIVYIFKAKTWKNIALDDAIDSRVNEFNQEEIYEGCIAIAVSDLRPMGTIEFENEQFEASTNGEFIDRMSSVKVLSVTSNQIIVEKIN